MTKDIFISIVIPLYNKQNAIADTIQSVINQTVTSFEIIVVDDGSTDNSLAVVQKIKDKRIRIIKKENGGVSSARNMGIKAANGKYVALLDGDDLWEPTFIEEQIKLIMDFFDAGMWGVNYAFVKNGKSVSCDQGLGDGYRGYVNNYFNTSHNDLFCSSSVVIRKDVFDISDYFDERISSSEDLDMWYRIILHFPVVFYDKVLVYYNQDAENRVAYDTDVRFPLTKDIKYYFNKYQSYFDHRSDFSFFLNNYVATNLLKDGYYFGTKQERIDSDVVVSALRYKDIHPKYKWIFKTPRWFGMIIYKLVCLKKKIKL